MVKNYSITDNLQNYARKLAKKRKPFPEKLEELKKRNQNFKEKFLQCLGDMPENRYSLNVQVRDEFKLDNYPVICHSILYQSEPDVTVPALVYKPLEFKGKIPGILFLGGWVQSKWEYRSVTAELSSQGYIVLVPDCRFVGERKTYSSESEQFNLVPIAQLLGKTFMGMNSWDNMRAIDYLQSREDTDKERIGVIGCCWGGMQAWTLAAIDERVKVAIAINGTSTYEALIREFSSYGYHDCLGTYIPGLLKYGDIPDILALIAPRPLLLMNNINDWWFPVSGYLKVCQELEKVYQTYGAPERFQHFLYATIHDYPPESVKEATAWFKKYLK